VDYVAGGWRRGQRQGLTSRGYAALNADTLPRSGFVQGSLCRPPNYAERVWSHAVVTLVRVDGVHGSPIPFGIVWSFRAPPEGEQEVVRLEPDSLAALVGLSFARAASLRARWACNYVCVVSTDS
jgi:hypothetical protein